MHGVSSANAKTRDVKMADHEHGSMDFKAQEKTFNGFVSFVTRTVIIILVLLVLMAIFIR
jgi:hypothetical protein